MKKYLKAAILWVSYFWLICLCWAGAEYWYEGAVHESYVDTVVAIILAIFMTSDTMKGCIDSPLESP